MTFVTATFVYAGKGIQDFRVDLDNKRVFVKTDSLESAEILQVLKKTGKETELVGQTS